MSRTRVSRATGTVGEYLAAFGRVSDSDPALLPDFHLYLEQRTGWPIDEIAGMPPRTRPD